MIQGGVADFHGNYAAFGKVTEGMDKADKSVNVKGDAKDKSLECKKIKKVII